MEKGIKQAIKHLCFRFFGECIEHTSISYNEEALRLLLRQYVHCVNMQRNLKLEGLLRRILRVKL